MTKQKSTKRALLLSALSLLMCVSMLIGSTFAWFTDSVTSSGNIIKSGTLDVTMEWADGTKAVPADDSTDWKDASAGAIFESELWEPGYTEVRHIKIANEGTLALKYQLNIIANGEVSELADVIDVYYVDPAVQVADRTALTDANKLGTLTDVLANISTTASGNLEATEKHTITLALKMQENAGNKYQGLSIGSDFSIQLLATQLTSEFDSFDDQYDKFADYDGEISNVTSLIAALKNGGTYKLTSNITVDEAINVPAGVEVNLNLNGNTVTGNALNDGAKANAIVNNGTLTLANGTISAVGTNGGSAVYNKGNLTLENVTVNGASSNTDTGTASYAVITDGAGSILTVNNSNISGRGAIGAMNGTNLVINGGTYHTPEIAWGHAIYAVGDGTEVTINDGTFSEGYEMTANNWGMYQIYAGNNAKVVINGGDFSQEWDCANGYDLCTANGGVIVIKGGTFADDPSNQNGINYVADGCTAYDNGDGTFTVMKTRFGKVAYRPYILNGSRKAIQIDFEKIYAEESLVVELWHKDTLLTTTTYAGSYPCDRSTYTTCCVAMPGSVFWSWDTTFADGVSLSADNIPDTIKVYADGILVDTFTHSSGTVFADKVNDYLAIITE